ncbi:hypothetical protein [Sandaracinus amylolyticus]|nr:hypothetical protein [Sandaracinus amylolyticus]
METVIQQAGTQRDTSAYETRTRLRVTVRPTNQAIEGALVPHGTHLVDVPASRVVAVRALVETEEDRRILDLARASHERGLKAWAEKGLSDSTYGGSVEAEFYKITQRSVPVLTACEVVEEGIAPPLTPEQRMTNGVLAQLVSLLKQPSAPVDEPASKATTKKS